MIRYKALYVSKQDGSVRERSFRVGDTVCGIRNIKIEKLNDRATEYEKEWWHTCLKPTLIPNGEVV